MTIFIKSFFIKFNNKNRVFVDLSLDDLNSLKKLYNHLSGEEVVSCIFRSFCFITAFLIFGYELFIVPKKTSLFSYLFNRRSYKIDLETMLGAVKYCHESLEIPEDKRIKIRVELPSICRKSLKIMKEVIPGKLDGQELSDELIAKVALRYFIDFKKRKLFISDFFLVPPDRKKPVLKLRELFNVKEFNCQKI
jgi:hypothetical protein